MENKRQRINELVVQLGLAKDAYYNNEPLISDQEFDELEEELKSIDPDNFYFNQVGSSVTFGNKVKHEVPMKSMNKAKTIEELEVWLNKINKVQIHTLTISPKVDGLSGAIVYENGKIKLQATRGDGLVGRDITQVQISNVPKTIKDKRRIEVRGEIYIERKYDKWFEYKPLRNIAVGFVNRKENLQDHKYLKFVAYNVLGTEYTKQSVKIDWLHENGFHVPQVFEELDIKHIKKVYENYLEQRNELEYETDGIVLCVDDEHYHDEINAGYNIEHAYQHQIAVKPPMQEQETILESIEWQLSRNGLLTPVAKFKPVTILGRQITRASLYNYKNVVSNKINIGCKITVAIAGDVIPKITKVDSNIFNESIVPTECPSCGSKLIVDNDTYLKCKNDDCYEKQIQKIVYWITQCEFDNIAEQTIRLLYEKDKIKCIKDLYTLTASDLEGVPGIAQKTITNILNEIKTKREMTFQEFVARIGIPTVHVKALKKLNINTLDDLLKFNDDTYVIGQKVIEWLRELSNVQFLHELLSCLIIKEEKVKSSNVDAKKICMTGAGMYDRKTLIKMIENKGDEFVSSVTKNTDVLLVEDPKSGTVKIKNAEKLGVKVISYSEYFGE